jgi:16S rRNA (guanine527-N7)-methyltransferase
MEILLKYFSDFNERQLNQLRMLDELYKDWNSKINVISRKDIDGLYEKHVLHSLSIAAVFPFTAGMQILDIGTGGGFPGIPLAIFFPEVQFHLADSIGKKLKVVQAISEAIGLKNVTTQHTRAEEIKNRKFDFVVSRAVAPIKDLWRWSQPLLKKKIEQITPADASENEKNWMMKPGLICLKGGDLALEIQESNTRPRVLPIEDIFEEASFKDKFLLYITR